MENYPGFYITLIFISGSPVFINHVLVFTSYSVACLCLCLPSFIFMSKFQKSNNGA